MRACEQEIIKLPGTDIQESLCPSHLQDDFSRELVSSRDYGFMAAKRLPDGVYVGIKGLFTTYAVCIGIDAVTAYRRRYCYVELSDCLDAYEKLQNGLSVPEGWVAQRPPP